MKVLEDVPHRDHVKGRRRQIDLLKAPNEDFETHALLGVVCGFPVWFYAFDLPAPAAPHLVKEVAGRATYVEQVTPRTVTLNGSSSLEQSITPIPAPPPGLL